MIASADDDIDYIPRITILFSNWTTIISVKIKCCRNLHIRATSQIEVSASYHVDHLFRRFRDGIILQFEPIYLGDIENISYRFQYTLLNKMDAQMCTQLLEIQFMNGIAGYTVFLYININY